MRCRPQSRPRHSSDRAKRRLQHKQPQKSLVQRGILPGGRPPAQIRPAAKSHEKEINRAVREVAGDQLDASIRVPCPEADRHRDDKFWTISGPLHQFFSLGRSVVPSARALRCGNQRTRQISKNSLAIVRFNLSVAVRFIALAGVAAETGRGDADLSRACLCRAAGAARCGRADDDLYAAIMIGAEHVGRRQPWSAGSARCASAWPNPRRAP